MGRCSNVCVLGGGGGVKIRGRRKGGVKPPPPRKKATKKHTQKHTHTQKQHTHTHTHKKQQKKKSEAMCRPQDAPDTHGSCHSQCPHLAQVRTDLVSLWGSATSDRLPQRLWCLIICKVLATRLPCLQTPFNRHLICKFI